MKQVFYKGQPYDFQVIDMKGKRQYQLFQNDTLMYSVDQSELDIKSIVSLILEAYYQSSRKQMQANTIH
jgi:hypothetical protein